MKLTWTPHRLSLAAALTALVLYGVTLSPGYMPGQSSFSLLQALPSSSFPTFGHTLWHTLVEALDALPIPLHTTTGMLAALCGALTVYGLGRMAFCIPLGDTPEEQRTPVPMKLLRTLMVGGTLLVAILTQPLWFSATRPFPQGFGLMTLSLLGALTLETFRQRQPWMLSVSTLLWGWVVTEYAAAWFFLPFFGLAVLFTGFDGAGQFRWGRNLKLLGLWLLGAGLGYLWMSVRVLGHANAEIQGMSHLGEALLNSLRVQRSQLMAAAPDRGSLLVLFLFGGPFLVVMMPKQHGTLDVRIGSVFLHISCALITIVMLFHPGFSPWGLYQQRQLGVFMVVPYAMLAMSTGYLSAYWVAVLGKYDQYQPVYLKVPRFTLRLLVGPVILVVWIASTVMNVWHWGDPTVKEVNRLADSLAETASSYDYYWGESGFNHVLKLSLRDKGSETEVLDSTPGLWQRPVFRRILARRFEGNPRLVSMAEIGPLPLLAAMMEEWPDFHERVLLADGPDVLYRQGLVPIVVPGGYIGREEVDPETVMSSWESLAAWWSTLSAEDLWEGQSGLSAHRADGALRQYLAMESRRANNLAVQLEQSGELEKALSAYRESRRLMPGNISALLNLVYHSDQLEADEREALSVEVKELMETAGNARLRLWRISDLFGYITHPMAYVQRGMGWVISGKPDLAVKEYERALNQNPDVTPLQLQLAHAQLAGEDLVEAEKSFLNVLATEPESINALLGMSRVYLRRGELDSAKTMLDRLAELDIDQNILFRQRLVYHLIAGETEEQKATVDTWLKESRNAPEPMLAALTMALDAGDETEAEKWMTGLQGMGRLPPRPALGLARILMAQGEGDAARVHLRQVIANPTFREAAIETFLQLALIERDRKETETWVNALLELDPGHARANYLLGTLRYFDGRLGEAESAFRASLRREETAFAANDLAYLLMERDRADEALTFAKKALSLQPDIPGFQDTLASILLALNRAEDALAVQVEAVNRFPDNPGYLLTLARIYDKLGQTTARDELVSRLYGLRNRLTARQQEQLRELTKTGVTP